MNARPVTLDLTNPANVLLLGVALGFPSGCVFSALCAEVALHRRSRRWARTLETIDLAHRAMLASAQRPTIRRPPQPLAAPLRARKPPSLMDTAQMTVVAPTGLLEPVGCEP